MVDLLLGNRPTKSKYITLPKDLISVPGTQYEAFDSTTGWTQLNGTLAVNNTEYKENGASLKITSAVGGTGNASRVINWDMSNHGMLSLWIYVHSPIADYQTGAQIYVTDQTSFATHTFYYTLPLSWCALGWNFVHIPKSWWVTVGSPSWANPMIRMKIQCVAKAGLTVAASFDDLKWGYVTKPAIIIGFADGYASTYSSGYPIMRAVNMPGTLVLQTERAGPYITWAQIQEMNSMGWCIANHTNAATDLSTLSAALQEAQILGGINDLINNGLSKGAYYLSPPGGGRNADTLTAIANTNTVLCFSNQTPVQRPALLPPYDILYIEQTAGWTDTLALATAKGWVDTAITDGTILNTGGHDLDAALNWTTATFQSFIDYVRIKARAGLIYPITLDDYYKLTLGPVRVRKVK